MRRFPAVLLAGLTLVTSGPAAAQEGRLQELPLELRGRVRLELLSCQPHSGSERLRQARLRVESGSTEVFLPDLQCGAFAPGSERALFLNAVDGAARVPPHTRLELDTVFPADSIHRECRCVVGGVRRLGGGSAGSEWSDAPLREEPLSRAEGWRGPRRGAGERPPGGAVLRRELVLLPEAPVHQAPRADSPVEARLTAGQEIEVLSLEAGWKEVRGDPFEAGWKEVQGDSFEPIHGWIQDDAATSDLGAPARISRVLGRARAHLAAPREGGGTTGALCSEVREEDLRALAFAVLPDERTAYLSALWYALPERDRDTFQLWASECHGVTRLVEVARGLEIRSRDWGDSPRLSGRP